MCLSCRIDNQTRNSLRMSHTNRMRLLLVLMCVRNIWCVTNLLPSEDNSLELKKFVFGEVIILTETKDLLTENINFDYENVRSILLWEAYQKRPVCLHVNYVLLTKRCEASEALQKIVRRIDDNNGYYIIVCKSFKTTGDIKNIFKAIHAFGVTVIKVVINSEDTVLYSWDPYHEDSECGKRISLTVTESSDLRNDVFTQTKSKQLKDCRIKIIWIRIPPLVVNVTALKGPGVYVSLFNTIHELTGVNIEYFQKEEFSQEFILNGSYYQLVQYLQNGTADVGIGRLYMNATHETLGPCIFSDEMIFLARKRKKFHSYRYLLKIFTWSLWLSMAATFLITCALFVISGKFFKDSRIELYDIVTELFRICLGTGGNILFRTHNMKVLLIFYSLYCLNMDVLYLSKLSSQLSTPNQEKKISHVDLLVQYRVHIYSPWIGERLGLLLYYTSRNKTWYGGGHVWNYTEYQLLRHIVSHQENSTIAFSSTLKTFPSETAAATLFRWPMYWPLFVTYYLRPNNPLNGMINFWTQETLEKGFIQKWWQDIARSNVNNSFGNEETDPPLITLKIAHFEEIFCLLLGGWFVAIVSFFLEITGKF